MTASLEKSLAESAVPAHEGPIVDVARLASPRVSRPHDKLACCSRGPG